jgi:hypothetical protein
MSERMIGPARRTSDKILNTAKPILSKVNGLPAGILIDQGVIVLRRSITLLTNSWHCRSTNDDTKLTYCGVQKFEPRTDR